VVVFLLIPVFLSNNVVSGQETQTLSAVIEDFEEPNLSLETPKNIPLPPAVSTLQSLSYLSPGPPHHPQTTTTTHFIQDKGTIEEIKISNHTENHTQSVKKAELAASRDQVYFHQENVDSTNNVWP